MVNTIEKDLDNSVAELINQKNLLEAQKTRALANNDSEEVEKLQEQIEIIDEQIQKLERPDQEE